jgi:uncharacterized protein YjbJ (UPF0337 family)
VTGNKRLQAKGKRDQAAAASRLKKGQSKEYIKTWMNRL